MIFRFAYRDLLRHWRFSLFFVFNLAIGLTGFVTLETFKNALQDHLTTNAKNILAADIAVEARRELSDNEIQLFQKIPATATSVVYDFFAMASVIDQSKLVMVKAIEGGFPLYGTLQFRSGRMLMAKDMQEGKAWVYPEILEQFSVKVGDRIKLGRVEFLIDDVIEKDSTQTFRSASMAPRIYISLNQLKATGLIQFGSTFSKEWLFKLKEGTDIALLKENIYKDIADPAVRVETPETASEDVGRQLNYLSDYLGLVTLVALFLSALGAAYLFRLYLQEKIKDIAILRSLGLRASEALKVYLLQTFLLGIAAIVISFVISLILLPIITKVLLSLLPFPLHLQLTGPVFLTGFILAVFGSSSISLPYLLKIREISVSQLFSEEHFQSQLGAPRWLALIPAIVLFVLLAIYQSHSLKMGFGFSLGLTVTILVLAILSWLLLSFVTRWPLKKWSFKFALLSLSRKKIGALALFVSLALGAMLINILPQLKVTLQSSMSVEDGSKLPSLFVFDVQDDQMEALKSYFDGRKQSVLNFSPLIRSRIVKVNDQDFERKVDSQTYKTREEERESRFRNRGVNITFRNSLSESEEIIEGQPFSDRLDPLIAELSVEFRYADRLGLKLGDVMVFDIQGVEVKGRIINFRSVRWTSFQPNFFIAMQPGFLEDAPKTFIGALPRIPAKEKLAIQRDLAKQFSNVSIIDVDRMVGDILGVAEQMSLSLELMAWLSIVAGYVVLFSIVRTQVQSRRWELNMLKILGAKPKDLNIYILAEVLVVTLLAASIGAALSLAASAVLSKIIFESSLRLNVVWIFSSIIGITTLSLLIAWLAARQVMREKPHHILTENN
jgi:putative ABC transport system permease protein